MTLYVGKWYLLRRGRDSDLTDEICVDRLERQKLGYPESSGRRAVALAKDGRLWQSEARVRSTVRLKGVR